jgi:uncharacterized protein YndB with AHSA1/START domain
MTKPMHVYRTYIRADAERVWAALTDPEFTKEYFHAQRFESSLEPGSPWRFAGADGTESVVGTVEEVDPPRRLVLTWRVLYDATAAEEPPSRVVWELEPVGDDLTMVTTTHRDLGLSPVTAASVANGWYWVHGSLKSFVETGSGLPAREAKVAAVDDSDGADHRRYAIDANNSTWELLERAGSDDGLTPDEVDDLLGRAYAASYHWRRAAGREPANDARAAWLLSRAHAVLGDGEVALRHADRCADVVAAAGLTDFDLAYAYEARARALACLGRLDEAAAQLAAAKAVEIADADDRAIVEGDVAAGPWYGLETSLDPVGGDAGG